MDWSEIIQDLHGTDIDQIVHACEKIDEVATEKHIPDLYNLIEYNDFYIREAVAIPLARIEGVKAIPALFHALTLGEQDGHDNDGLCATIAGFLEANSLEASQIMIKMLKDPNSEVRANAAWGLGFVHDNVSPEELLNFLIYEKELEVKANLIGSLEIYKGNETVSAELIKLLDDESERIQIAVISSLGYIGDKRAIPYLEEKLGKSTGRVREFIQSSLKQLEKRKEESFIRRLFFWRK